VFVAVDHCSAECVGIHAAQRATRFEALEPLRQGVRRHFGGFAQGIARGLARRHDHGSQHMADAFQEELRFLGVESSPAFVRAPEGNGCAERCIRTLKENLLWLRTFATVEGRGHCPRPPGAARLSRDLQRDLADRAARLQAAQCRPTGSAFNRGPRRICCKPASQHPRAVHG
jgi:transposase InsO family protein